jgi:hypothetical protein
MRLLTHFPMPQKALFELAENGSLRTAFDIGEHVRALWTLTIMSSGRSISDFVVYGKQVALISSHAA